MGSQFGSYLRGIRRERGIGLKRVAPQVDLSYTFLSKLENGHVEPSGETIERLARFYGIASEEMALAAGKLPRDVVDILREHPDEAVALLRARFGR